MKKHLFIISAAAIVAACAQEELPENGNVPAGEAVCYVSATTCDTKTYLEEKSEGVYKVLWAAEDKVSVNGQESISADITDDKSSATFGFSTELSDPVDMVYPSSVVTGYSERTAQVSLPASQKYVSGSFDPASGLVYGSGTQAGGVALDHAMAYMKVVPSIASDHEGHNIASFSITTAGEAVSGAFTLDFADGTLTAAAEGTGTAVTVKCGDTGVASGNGIIIAIPAQTYAAGMKMTLTDTQGCTYTATSSRALEAVAGKIYTTELAFDPMLVEEYYYDFTVPANVKSPSATSSGSSAVTLVYSDDTEFAISNGRYNEKNENDVKSYYLVISGKGSYISLPAVEGKRLSSVRMMTSGSARSMAIASDTEGTLVTGGDKHEYTGTGELADHTWYLEGTLANTSYYGVVPSDGNSTTMTIRKMWLTYEEAGKTLIAEACEQRSSTLSFKWEYNDGTSPANVAYTVNLYDSSDNLVRSHTYPTTGDIVRKFVFAGLDQNTTYKFEVVDPDGIRSEKVSATTKPFTVVTIPEQPLAPSATNVTILAEDMSLLSFDGDKNNNAAGFAPATRKIDPDFTNGTVVNPDGGVGLFSNATLRGSLSGTRLEGWAYENYAIELAGAGYFKLGAYASGNWASIFSPVLTCIPEGYTAKVKVTMNVAHYDWANESNAAMVTVVDGGSTATYKLTGYTEGDSEPITMTTEFAEHEVVLEGVSNASRIKFGPDFVASESLGQRRIMVAGMKVEVLSLEWASAAEVEISKVYYSEATATWGKTESAVYNVYVNDVKCNEEPLSEPTFHVTGLENNTTYNLTVGTVVGGKEAKSVPVEFKTKNVWIVNKGRTNVCVQWDDISTGTAADGKDKGYMIEVLKADKTTSVFGEMFCGQNVISSTASSSAFSSTDRLGKTNGVNHFPQMRVAIGLLDPATTYYVRVRSLDGFSSTISATLELNNSAGNSEWSSLVEFTTDAPHVAGANEVIWTGFDECGVLPDYKNMCAGLAPMLTSGKSTAVFATDKSQYQWGFYPFQSVGHMLGTVGYNAKGKYVDAAATHRSVDNYVMNKGSMSGWHSNQEPKPGIGVLLMNGTYNKLYLGTPALAKNLPEDGTEVKCKVTVTAGFYASGTSLMTTNAYFDAYKWNGTEHVSITTKNYVGKPSSDYVDANNYTTSIHTVTNEFEVMLKKGDNVKFHVSNSNVFFDEILIEVVE